MIPCIRSCTLKFVSLALCYAPEPRILGGSNGPLAWSSAADYFGRLVRFAGVPGPEAAYNAWDALHALLIDVLDLLLSNPYERVPWLAAVNATELTGSCAHFRNHYPLGSIRS